MTDYEKAIRKLNHYDLNLEIERVLGYLDHLQATKADQRRIDATERRADILAKVAAEAA